MWLPEKLSVFQFHNSKTFKKTTLSPFKKYLWQWHLILVLISAFISYTKNWFIDLFKLLIYTPIHKYVSLTVHLWFSFVFMEGSSVILTNFAFYISNRFFLFNFTYYSNSENVFILFSQLITLTYSLLSICCQHIY